MYQVSLSLPNYLWRGLIGDFLCRWAFLQLELRDRKREFETYLSLCICEICNKSTFFNSNSTSEVLFGKLSHSCDWTAKLVPDHHRFGNPRSTSQPNPTQRHESFPATRPSSYPPKFSILLYASHVLLSLPFQRRQSILRPRRRRYVLRPSGIAPPCPNHPLHCPNPHYVLTAPYPVRQHQTYHPQ